MKPAGRKPKALNGRGEVRSEAVYPLTVLMKRLGIARNTLSSLRRRGLPVHFLGRRCALVYGWELLAFLRRRARRPKTPRRTGKNERTRGHTWPEPPKQRTATQSGRNQRPNCRRRGWERPPDDKLDPMTRDKEVQMDTYKKGPVATGPRETHMSQSSTVRAGEQPLSPQNDRSTKKLPRRQSCHLADNRPENGDSLSSDVFCRPDWTLFRNLSTLGQRAGVTTDIIPALVVKELVDNALDAAAQCHYGQTADGGLFVQDDGDGLPGTDAEVASLFSVARPLSSTKLLRLPTRGALGNGLRVVVGAVLASGGTLTVSTRGRALHLRRATQTA